jgi:hypothetical protein
MVEWQTANNTQWIVKLVSAVWDSLIYTWDSIFSTWDGISKDSWFETNNTDWNDISNNDWYTENNTNWKQNK